MSLSHPITLLIPLGGIALILVAVWLTGGARRARLDRALVLCRLDEDLPDFAVAETSVDADGATALALADDGVVGLGSDHPDRGHDLLLVPPDRP